MAITLGNADAQVLTAGSDVLAPTNETWFVTKATVNNQGVAAHPITVYRIPPGGSAGADNTMIYALSIPAGETYALPLSGQPFLENQVLRATCTATGVMTINVGYTIVPSA